MSNFVAFNPPVRTSSKRKRMPGTNKDNKTEVKKCAMFVNTYSLDNIYSLFEFSNIFGVYGIQDGIDFRGSWIPIPILHPGIGATGYNRVGQEYFIKYFRMKGYCLVKANCVRPIHWRLRLIRVEDEGVFKQISPSMNVNEVINDYLSTMYRNPYLLETNDALLTKAAKLASNYYCCLKTRLESKTITSKIIASGSVASVNPAQTVGIKQPQQDQAWVSLVSNTLGINNENWAYSKFDVRVLVNDSIGYRYFKNSNGETYQITDIDYYVVLETDLPYGFDIVGPNMGGSMPPAGAVLYSNSRLDEVINIRCSQIQYFTDP